MPPIVIELEGEVVAKGRPRFAMRGVGQRPIAYTPDKTRKYEERLRSAARQAMKGNPPFQGAVAITVLVTVPIRLSWAKWKKLAAGDGSIKPTSKPDLDNYIKTVQDALNGVVFIDDAQIVEIHAYKQFYGTNQWLQVSISEVKR